MSRTVLYAYGFDKAAKEVEAEVEAIGKTSFDTVILAFIHVEENLQVKLNDTPLEKLWPGLPAAIEKLKNGFPVKKRVLISIGPFQSDFDAIRENLLGFVEKLAKFNLAHHIDGIDLDYEGDYEPEDAKLVAEIANRYQRTARNALVTAAPYTAEEFWTGENGVLELARLGADANCFDWFNVQFYMGPSNQSPEEYPGTFDGWASEVGRSGNGIADPQDFVVPGCNGSAEAHRNFSPTDMETGLKAIREKHSSIGGGFVWNYEGLEWTPAAWADAIVNGCHG